MSSRNSARNLLQAFLRESTPKIPPEIFPKNWSGDFLHEFPRGFKITIPAGISSRNPSGSLSMNSFRNYSEDFLQKFLQAFFLENLSKYFLQEFLQEFLQVYLLKTPPRIFSMISLKNFQYKLSGNFIQEFLRGLRSDIFPEFSSEYLIKKFRQWFFYKNSSRDF